MNQYITMEVKFFLMSVAWGAILLVIYDCLRIFRKVVKHGVVLISIEDIIYWVVSAVLIFRMMYQLNDGIIRGFSLLGILLGMTLYKYSISDYVVAAISFILIKIKLFLLKVLHIMLKPLQFIYKKLCKLFHFVWNRVHKFLGNIAHLAQKKVRSLCKTLQNYVKRSMIKKGLMNENKSKTKVNVEEKKHERKNETKSPDENKKIQINNRNKKERSKMLHGQKT